MALKVSSAADALLGRRGHGVHRARLAGGLGRGRADGGRCGAPRRGRRGDRIDGLGRARPRPAGRRPRRALRDRATGAAGGGRAARRASRDARPGARWAPRGGPPRGPSPRGGRGPSTARRPRGASRRPATSRRARRAAACARRRRRRRPRGRCGCPGSPRREGYPATGFLAGALHDALREVARHLLVALELHRVLALAAGQRAQVGRVGEHLGHRHLGLDLGHPRAARLHPLRPAPAGVEIADDVADRVLGHGDRHAHDRLEQHRRGALERLAHRQRRRPS